ncbi:MAG: menaquinone biosynthesis decarboxylase [Bacteroidetes bacterium]|nr:menaquinone biosynthesis decarboxylase [Bacteroidota bacterium]
MPYKSLQHFIAALDQAGELVRVKEFVSPHLEITEITDRISKNHGKALLFENTGSGFPLLINAFGSEKRMCMALGVKTLDAAGDELGKILQEFLGPKESFLEKLKLIPALKEISSWMPHLVSGKGSCQEVIMETPDLTKLPVLTCWPSDGGPFITLPVVHTKDPVTGIKNQGMYRMQVFGPTLTGMHWHRHKGSAHHFTQYKELGLRMPVSVTLGGDPVNTYAATAPLPENLDEYLLSGYLRKKKVELVKCLTNDLEVPADADFVIEGYVDPDEEFILEGPFGDHTGFYSLADMYPRFHVTCITHRKHAVYPATVVGIPPMEDEWMGKATERIFLLPMKMFTVPEMNDIDMPVEGVFHNIVLTSIHKSFPGQGLKAMTSLWGAGQMMFNKFMIVVNGTVDVHDYKAVAREVSERTDPMHEIHFMKGPVDVLDHSSRRFSFGSKMGIDATEKWPEEDEKAGIHFGEPLIDKNAILKKFPEITGMNDSLLQEKISIVIFSVKKNRKNHIRETGAELLRSGLISGIRFLIFMDPSIDLASFADVAWIAANNMDPMRDCFHASSADGEDFPVLLMDGTRKTPEFDAFGRDWPNVIVMDDTTIQKVDKEWDRYGLGPFFPSPSLKYKTLIVNEGPMVGKGF